MYFPSLPHLPFPSLPSLPPSLPPSSSLPPIQEQAAATILYCAAHPALADVSGLYWYECHPVEPSDDALDLELGAGLWQFSEQLIAERVNSSET